MGKLVCGVGINDADYSVKPIVNGRQRICKIYERWQSMLVRCYSEKSQHKFPTYIGCAVTKEWLRFSNFKEWMVKQDWQGKELDKDLLVCGNKIYSPDACMFVSKKINLLLKIGFKKKSSFPIGVNFVIKTGRFSANFGGNGEVIYLGCFTTPHQAHAAWQKAKIAIIREAAGAESDERLVAALHGIADKVQGDLDAGIETKSF